MIFLIDQERVLKGLAERLGAEYLDERVFIREKNNDGFTIDFTPTVPDGVRVGYVLDYGEKQSLRRKELQQILKGRKEVAEDIFDCPVYVKESPSGDLRWVKVTTDRRFGIYQVVRLDIDWKDEEELVSIVVSVVGEYMEAIRSIS